MNVSGFFETLRNLTYVVPFQCRELFNALELKYKVLIFLVALGAGILGLLVGHLVMRFDNRKARSKK